MVWVAEVTLLLVLLCLVHQSTLHRLVLVAPFRPTLFLLLSVREAGLRAVRSDCFSFCSSAWFIFGLLSLQIVGFFVGRFAVLVCGGVLYVATAVAVLLWQGIRLYSPACAAAPVALLAALV